MWLWIRFNKIQLFKEKSKRLRNKTNHSIDKNHLLGFVALAIFSSSSALEGVMSFRLFRSAMHFNAYSHQMIHEGVASLCNIRSQS